MENENNVVDFPKEDFNGENLMGDFPIQYFGYIDNVAAGVFGDNFGYTLTPAKTEEGENVVVMIAGSLKYDTVARRAIFDLSSMDEVRKACIIIAYELYGLEVKAEKSAGGKLIVPEKGLLIPGK